MILKCSNKDCSFEKTVEKDSAAYKTLVQIKECPYCQSAVEWFGDSSILEDGDSLFIIVDKEEVLFTYRNGGKLSECLFSKNHLKGHTLEDFFYYAKEALKRE